ncbi:type 1 glutamine amidotransferase domain-containing protein [Gilvimarinus sp. SDUM040013]|uniref:Type 1 glutamine amidotransferase domain-containing protein n=1 Tax=Gilvimarinus gilvus TaxID=3058038 RepID=A0ABU4RUR5_9GAMM|nr:type 1 glutamine amidotransferase domain-containing protein [Gilvimarinus sp. SDUM040013]MDO3388526.1 type 1 glutamine amidotransferase domain-containing protein [Gilvimarinus sp. SDUM040013]MDX6848602.1 type 1 glutamine amidotransferase domain-containing protein [Gilvimarinus sp. SDUM040013]
MSTSLKGKNVAILAAGGFEESELSSPREALVSAEVNVDIVSPNGWQITAWAKTNWGQEYTVDKTLEDANSDDYDMLVLPGGVFNPDSLRTNPMALEFTRDFFQQRKPVAAICHAPWLLISAGVVRNRKVTSYPSVKDDLVNAGARWYDRPVVVDSGLVTSRSPEDLEQFNAKILEELGEGKHEGQAA